MQIRFPYSWEERRPLIHEGMLFVPKYYAHHQEWTLPSFSDPQLFGNSHPVQIEYCSGNGSWIVERALRDPEKNWIAVEKKFERAAKIWARAKKAGVKNLFIVCGDAIEFTKFYLRQEHVFQDAYVNFPDPWPKEKHAKHRLLQGDFLHDLARVVVKGGSIVLVTDDAAYRDQVCVEMEKSLVWKPAFARPFFKTEWEGYGSSYFEELWRKKGKEIFYLQFTH